MGGRGKVKRMRRELEGGGWEKANTQGRKLGEKVPCGSKPASQRHVGSFHETMPAIRNC